MKWHLRVTFVPLKVFYVAMILAICISMPTYFVYEAIDFFSQVSDQPGLPGIKLLALCDALTMSFEMFHLVRNSWVLLP